MENEITLNNIKYYSEEKYLKDLNEIKEKLALLDTATERKKVLRFEEKKFVKLVKLMSGIFSLQTESVSEEWAFKNDFNVVDPANVCMVMPKTEEAKRLLALFIDFENEKTNPVIDFTPKYEFFPELEPKEQIKIKEQRAKFSQEYIRKILEILNITDDGVVFTLKRNTPILIENNHFKFILAPRVENEDDY